MGTFSKILAPALRIGFLVLPEPLVGPFVRAREVTDHHPPMATQATLAEFIAEGHLERHVARMRNVYAERRAALLGSLRAELADRVEVLPGSAGLHLTVLLRQDIDDDAVCRLAMSRSLDPQPLSAHYIGTDRRSGLVLGYGGFPPGTLEFAVRTLGECIAAASTDGEPLDQD